MHAYKFHRTLFQSVAMDNLYWNYLGCLKIYIYECYKRPIGVMPQESFFKKEKQKNIHGMRSEKHRHRLFELELTKIRHSRTLYVK